MFGDAEAPIYWFMNEHLNKDQYNHSTRKTGYVIVVITVLIITATAIVYFLHADQKLTKDMKPSVPQIPPQDSTWTAPKESTIPDNEQGKQIRYGRELIAYTAKYFGPNGRVA